MKKTSDEWASLYPKILVLDPDGWDIKNFKYSWYDEKITLKEYKSRLMVSTISAKYEDIIEIERIINDSN